CEPGNWGVGFTAFGEILPYHENKISLDKNVKDKWGLPVLNMDMEIKENEMKMRKDMTEEKKEMLQKIGVKDVYTYDSGYHLGTGIQEIGPSQRGAVPKTPGMTAANPVWDAKNLSGTDGPALTSASRVNPSLTYMAMTGRALAFAVSELEKGNG